MTGVRVAGCDVGRHSSQKRRPQNEAIHFAGNQRHRPHPPRRGFSAAVDETLSLISARSRSASPAGSPVRRSRVRVRPVSGVEIMTRSSSPIVHFYRLIDEARLPQRADRSAAGTLPTRAYRYCEAVTSASGFGWWIFPPTDLQFMWDGHDI